MENLHLNKGNRSMANTPAQVKGRPGMWLVAALLLLSLPPLLSGAFRLAELAHIADIMPPRERFHAVPLPVVLHIISAAIYAIGGAFQFITGRRHQWFRWHLIVGRVLVGCGVVVGLSALWMTLFYADANNGSNLLFALRLLFGIAMLLSLVLGIAAIRRRDIRRHRNWMTRAYAIGLGASTQMLTLMLGELIAGPPGELAYALLMGLGWGINLAVAEWAIRKQPSMVIVS
jgi:uncharacterized membrane protein